MIKPIWSKAPEWASYFVELEGGRVFWSDKEYSGRIGFNLNESLPAIVLPDVEDSNEFFSLRVVQCTPRPKWKTLIHFKWDGVVVTYEAEGKLTHSTVKRQLMDEMGVDASIRVMLEYIEIV
jgi:hypothetical protein